MKASGASCVTLDDCMVCLSELRMRSSDELGSMAVDVGGVVTRSILLASLPSLSCVMLTMTRYLRCQAE